MEQKKTHIDDLFRRELGKHTEEPDPAIWESLAGKLDASPVSAPPQMPVRVPVSPLLNKWIWYLALPSFTLVGGFFIGRNWEKIESSEKIRPQIAIAEHQAGNASINENATGNDAGSNGEDRVANKEKLNDSTGFSGRTSDALAQTEPGKAHRVVSRSVKSEQQKSQNIADGKTPREGTNSHVQKGNARLAEQEYLKESHAVNSAPDGQTIAGGGMQDGGAAKNTDVNGPVAIAQLPQGSVRDSASLTAKAAPLNVIDMLTAGRRKVFYFYKSMPWVSPYVTDEQLARYLFPAYMRRADSNARIAQANDTPGYKSHQADAYNTMHDTYSKKYKISHATGGNRGGFNEAGAKRMLNLPRIDMEGWLKAGYETGKTNKLVASAYLQYNISRKLGIAIQPTAKYVYLKGMTLSEPVGYISDVKYTRDSGHVMQPHLPNDTTKTPRIQRNYFYTQQYDTFVISNAVAATKYFEFELPVIVKYNVTKRLGVQVGVLVNFTKTAQIAENRVQNTITKRDTLSFGTVSTKQPVPQPRPATNFFKAPVGTNISQYDGTPYLNAEANSLRWGYSLGLSYAVHDRVSVEVVVQQMLLGNSGIPNKTVRDIYTQPYVRAMLGYRLFKTKK